MIKNMILKVINKIDNVKISPFIGWPAAILLFVTSIFLIGLSNINVIAHLSVILAWATILLAALTPKSKKDGNKFARVMAVIFFTIGCHLANLIPNERYFHGEDYFGDSDLLVFAVEITFTFLGYFLGKFIYKKNKAAKESQSPQS